MRLVPVDIETAECITASDVKQFSRIDIVADDAMLTNVFIPSARQFVSDYINCSVVPQTWVAWFDSIKDKFWLKRFLELPHNRIIEITSVKYYDDENDETVYSSSNYFLSGGRLVLNASADWPSNLRDFDSIKVEFISGWGERDEEDELVSSVPANIKLAMMMIAAHWYEQREANSDVDFKNVPMNATALLSPYRNIVL